MEKEAGEALHRAAYIADEDEPGFLTIPLSKLELQWQSTIAQTFPNGWSECQ